MDSRVRSTRHPGATVFEGGHDAPSTDDAERRCRRSRVDASHTCLESMGLSGADDRGVD